MRISKTLQKLRSGQPARMCCLGHVIPSYIRHAAHFGYDCIWLDLEHRAMDYREVQSLLALFHLYDIDCMLRPPTLEKPRLYRFLEDGASGLMIPHVSTVEMARTLVDAVKFPPIGGRGLDGAGLDSDFYVRGGDEYVVSANRETFLVVQIETPQAVENVEQIAAIDGIDGLFIGPGDLGLRLKHADGSLTLESAIERVAAAAAKHGKAWGCPAATADIVSTLRQQGAQLIAYGGEYMTLMNMLKSHAADLDRVYGDGSDVS